MVRKEVYYALTDFVELRKFLTSIDVLPSINQELCEYCTHVSNY